MSKLQPQKKVDYLCKGYYIIIIQNYLLTGEIFMGIGNIYMMSDFFIKQ